VVGEKVTSTAHVRELVQLPDGIVGVVAENESGMKTKDQGLFPLPIEPGSREAVAVIVTEEDVPTGTGPKLIVPAGDRLMASA